MSFSAHILHIIQCKFLSLDDAIKKAHNGILLNVIVSGQHGLAKTENKLAKYLNKKLTRSPPIGGAGKTPRH